MLDDLVHTNEQPLCSDPTCPCHEDSNVVREYVIKPLDNGLLTNREAIRLFWGKQITDSPGVAITDETVVSEPSWLRELYRPLPSNDYYEPDEAAPIWQWMDEDEDAAITNEEIEQIMSEPSPLDAQVDDLDMSKRQWLSEHL